MKATIYNYRLWIDETNPYKLKTLIYNGVLLASGFNVLDIKEHYFEPYGYTCLYLLAESHFAIHTFPEENKTYIEMSSCNMDKCKASTRRLKAVFSLENTNIDIFIID